MNLSGYAIKKTIVFELIYCNEMNGTIKDVNKSL